MARLVSVNVGMPRDIDWRGRSVHTGIWEHRVRGRCRVRRLNLEATDKAITPPTGMYLFAASVLAAMSSSICEPTNIGLIAPADPQVPVLYADQHLKFGEALAPVVHAILTGERKTNTTH